MTMRTFRHSFSLTVVAIAIAAAGILSSIARAEEGPTRATGTLTGKVLDDKGQPAKGVNVAALVPGTLAARRNPANKPAADAPPTTEKSRMHPLAKTTTADDGTYTLTDVPVGKVRVIAGKKGSGFGIARELVTVKAGETTQVEDIHLHTAADRPNHPKPGTGTANP